ncbi:hypothetical protein EDD18DRAFT_1062742 [Armillaria luteobubalina]|uniref:EF-hand domain-containing protein n=1 Tax=Armillaria luteobubalina TaxID=153913 RepID=A0AA39TZ06_9AGAR|nr:hypothetical protein EDD18DRAFT_1062742 [Armillaria luteobubalina]
MLRLQHVKDPKVEGPDNITIHDQIGGLMKTIAQDIKNTSSVCDSYQKKSTMSRIIKSVPYHGIFAEHVEKLIKDRGDLDMALQIHIGMSVDAANAKLEDQKAVLNSIDRKVENWSAKMEKLFRLLETSRERDVRIFIEDKGGVEKCIKHDDLLGQLIEKSGKGYDDILGAQFGSSKSPSETMEKARKELLRELTEDAKKVFEKDMKSFGSKLELQEKALDRQAQQLQEILDAVKPGAHNRINDNDFKRLWEGMAWNRSVKAKYLVLALHDYFIEKLKPPGRPDEPIPAEYEKDRWTLAYLNSPHFQPLLEAIDDDATGFITIREINTFMESKPKEWMLLQWIAYWAGGWKISINRYKNDIYMLITAMYKICPRVLPANRYAVITYLQHENLFQIDKILQSTQDPPPNAFKSMELLRLTQEFMEVERQCLQDNLGSMGYDIDTEYTVSLLTGPGRIERYIYTMLYLLLERHYRVFELATTVILDPKEIPDMIASLWILFAIVNERLESLASIFKQSNVDVEEKLKSFAFGMVGLYYDSSEKDLSSNGIADYIYRQSPFDADVEPPTGMISPDNLVHNTPSLPSGASYYSPSPPSRACASEGPIQGPWSGHVYDRHRSMFGLIQLNIESSAEGALKGKGVAWQHAIGISGNIMQNNQDGNGVVPASNDGDGGTITQQDELGAVEAMPDDATDLESAMNDVDAASQYTFVLRRKPASLWRFLHSGPPHLPVAAGSLARARWSFALKCVLDGVKRKNSPGKYFVERFIEAGRFIILARRELYEDTDYFPRLSELSAKEKEELEWLKCAIFPEFSLFPHAHRLCFCSSYGCDSCDDSIVGTRWACLTCINDSFTDTIDLCSSCAKKEESIRLRGFVHDASHVLLKCDTYVLDAHWNWIIRRARSMLVQIKKKLRSRSKGRAELAESNASNIARPLKCQACSEEVTLPCWVRVDSYCMYSENCLCDKCESKSKPPAHDSPEFGMPLLRLRIKDADDAAVEAVNEESRLAALENKFENIDQKLSVIMNHLDKVLKVIGNPLSDV